MVTLIERYVKDCLEEIGMGGPLNPQAVAFYSEYPDQLKTLTLEELIGLYFGLKDKSNEDTTS